MSRVRDKNPSPFPMDRGIDKILHADESRHVETGPAVDLSPAFSPLKNRLELLYYADPNLEEYLAQELAPLIDEAGLLMPNRFGAALRDGVEGLNAQAEDDPRSATDFRRAARIMGEQVTMRDLAQMYRSVVVKG
jgi:hypothetical protein